MSGILITALGPTEVTLIWDTNELATSTFRYGMTTHYGREALLTPTALLAHSASLVALAPSTTYHYCIDATDLHGNTTHSCDHTFSTNPPPLVADHEAPLFASVGASEVITTAAKIGRAHV